MLVSTLVLGLMLDFGLGRSPAAWAQAGPDSNRDPSSATQDATQDGLIAAGVFVVAAPDRAPDPIALAELGRRFRAVLSTDGRLLVRDIDRSLAERAGQIPAATLSEIRGLVELGEAMLERDRPADASVRLRAAIEQMTPRMDQIRPALLARAQYLLGVAHAVQGETRTARRLFEALSTWQPAFQVDDSAAEPAVRELWQATAASVKTLPVGSLGLTTSPAGARVYVDGRYLGRAPVSVDGLTVGTHYVRVELARHQPSAQEVSVYKHTRREFELALTPLPGADAASAQAQVLAQAMDADAPNPDATRQAAAALGQAFGLDHVIVITRQTDPDGDRIRAAVYDPERGQRLSMASVAADDTADSASSASGAPGPNPSDATLAILTRSLYSGVTIGEPAPTTTTVVAAPAPSPEAPIYRKWWFWTGVAAVAAAVVTPVFLLDDDDGPACPGGSVCGDVVWRF